MGSAWLIALLWSLISSSVMIEYLPFCVNLNARERIVVIIILLIGGPIFALNNVLMMILDSIFPEGWDDDNDRKY